MWVELRPLFVLIASLQEGADASLPGAIGPPEYSFGGQFLKMILTLAAFVALLLAIGWVYRKLGLKRALFGNAHAMIQILERRALSAKTALYLIEVDGRRLIVGDSPSGISHVADLQTGSERTSEISTSFEEIINRKVQS
jgi:flagellar biosynthetic protein FliO